MCPDWGRSQLPSTEISFLGKLFKKLPTMDFSARTAKASGLGRETTEEEESWKPLVGGFPIFLCLVQNCSCQRCPGSQPKSRGWDNTPCFPYCLLEGVSHQFAASSHQPDLPIALQEYPSPARHGYCGRRPSTGCSLYSSRCTEVHCTTSQQGRLYRGLSHSSSRSPRADTALLPSPACRKPQAPSPFKISSPRDKSSSSDQEARVGIC